MVNPRSKTKKTKQTKKTQNTSKTGFSQEDSDEQSTGSAALIGSNDDLLTEILLRVPVSSILRFKSVCKHWLWLLSHRHFTLRYDNKNILLSHGLFVSDIYVPFDVENPNPPFSSLDFYPDPYGIKIVQSCNGLLLCCRDRGDKCYRKYYVFNPTTKQFAIVPSVGGYRVRRSICFMGLGFHPTDFVNYKVVCVRELHKKSRVGVFFQIQIYSSVTRKWKISIKSFSSDYPIGFEKGVYCNGAIHWAPSQHGHSYFNIDDEQLHSLPLPMERGRFLTYINYFGESRGHLHLIVPSDVCGLDMLRLNVYELLGDHSGWFVKYQLDLDERMGASPEMGYPIVYEFKVIDVVRGAEEEDTFMVLMTHVKLITYNVHDKSFKSIYNVDGDYSFYGGWGFHRYTETLASI